VVRAGVLVVAVLAGACTPQLSDTSAIVSGPRLLAVASTPAEGPTGTAFTMTGLYVGPDGGADAGALSWATCLLQKPLGDPGSVAPACVEDASTGLASLGTGGTVKGTIPTNACELFGPESPPPAEGQPSARPTDPDATGGYYLPIRVAAPGAGDSVAFERIQCQPSGVTEPVFTAYATGYIPNSNPVVSSFALVGDAGTTPIPPAGSSSTPDVTVAPGATVSFQVGWPTCPTTVAACGGAETYLLIDPTTEMITTARESMVASWYASSGSFALDSSGSAAGDVTTTAENQWTAPSTPGAVSLWVVLRDARGGTGWGTYVVDVGGDSP
jgi:hypothetical protein